MTALRVKLLGSPEIYRDGERIVDFTYQKSLALFSYLIVTRQAHSRLSLATLLWGESSDSNARAQLRTALAELRQRLEPYLSVTRKTVAFNSEPDYWLDVDVFTSSCQSLQAEANSMADIERLKKAVELYRGNFLERFYVRNAVDFEQWQREQQEWLHKLAEQALYTLVEDSLSRGTDESYPEGLTYVNRLLSLTPWYEQAHRQKMRLLGLKGQRSEALAQYQRCVDILAEQFGAEPAAETTELFEQIKNDQLSPPSPKITSATPPHNLPAPVISFIGRKLELAELAKLLRNPDHRFITLVGEGGVGKTHLAQVAARQVLADFPDGVWFVPLLNLQPSASATPEMWPDMLATAIADAWGFRFYGQESPQHQLFNRLHSKNALLVLDNFEHLLPGGEFVLNLLKSAPGITVLVTSRARLKFRAEHALRLEGLPLPPTDSDPTAADYSSVQLFLDRGRRASPSFTVDDDTLPQVVRLCRFVEGLPLGIELISAWVEHLTLAEIIANLEQNLDFAAATYQDVPERHHCLRVVFEHSWQLLARAERQLLAALSVFRGDFGRNAALTVTEAELAPLAALVDKSLLKPTQPGRYGLHEVLRQFAAEKLATVLPETDTQAISQRHSRYYLRLVNEQGDLLYGNDPQPAVEELQAEMSNIRQAWEWGTREQFSSALEENGHVSQEEVLQMAQSIKGLIRLYDFRGLYQEGEQIFRTAAHSLRESFESLELSPAQTALLSRTVGAQGQFLLALGNFAEATTAFKEALALSHQIEGVTMVDVATNQMFLFRYLGDSHVGQSDYRSAFDTYTQSLNIAQSLSNRSGMAAALHSLAEIAMNQGQYEQAVSQATEALKLYQDVGNQKDTAFALNTLGTIAVRTGAYEQARQYYEQSLKIRRELDHPREIAESLNNLGTVMSEMGQLKEARQYYEECLAIIKESGNRAAIANILNNLGTLAGVQQKYQEAALYFEQSLQIRREMGDQYGVATSLNNLAAVARYVGDYATAKRLAEESLALHIEIAHRPGSVFCLDNLGYIAMAQGDQAGAWRYFRRALQESVAVKALALTVDALTGVAGLLAHAGDHARAAQILGLTLRHPATTPITHTNAEPILAALRQHLSKEQLQAQMEQGQTLDLPQVVSEI